MTFDQAQSPRLGQRVAPESTYVQIFDVDPTTETADLIEAAWPGMLVFRQDRGILQIYDGTAGAWQDVAGGVAGALTFVGPTEPPGTDYSTGDTWYDTDDNYQLYVWDADAGNWVVSSGLPPGVNTYRTPEDELPADDSGVLRIGDLWVKGEEYNNTYRWDGSQWVPVTNTNIDTALAMAGDNAGAIEGNNDAIVLLNQAMELQNLNIEDAEKAANTADGRVSMSDYEPQPVDVGNRVEGSLWFQRTRPRQNLVSNPSFEKNLAGWQASNATFERWDPAEIPVLAGDYCLRVTSTSTGNAVVEPSYAFEGEEAEWYAGSMFMQLVTGSGADCFATITFYDAANNPLLVVEGEHEDLVQLDPDPENWNRINVLAQAPPDTVSYRVGFHNPNPGDLWYLGACIVENLEELGKYFDGDSYDGYWEGGTGNPAEVPSENPGPGQVGWQESTSALYGNKILGIWELHAATWVRKFLTDDTLDQIDARKLTNLDQLTLPVGSVPLTALEVASVVASEALVQGDIVNIYNLSGDFRIRKANAAPGFNYPASGFVLDTVANGQPARVYQGGYNNYLSNLAPGTKWLSAHVPGSVDNTPPTAQGVTVQQVGYAAADAVLNFAPQSPVRIT